MDLDKLKLYSAPIVALLLLLVWYFAIRPGLNESSAPDADAPASETQAGPEPSSP